MELKRTVQREVFQKHAETWGDLSGFGTKLKSNRTETDEKFTQREIRRTGCIVERF